MTLIVLVSCGLFNFLTTQLRNQPACLYVKLERVRLLKQTDVLQDRYSRPNCVGGHIIAEITQAVVYCAVPLASQLCCFDIMSTSMRACHYLQWLQYILTVNDPSQIGPHDSRCSTSVCKITCKRLYIILQLIITSLLVSEFNFIYSYFQVSGLIICALTMDLFNLCGCETSQRSQSQRNLKQVL